MQKSAGIDHDPLAEILVMFADDHAENGRSGIFQTLSEIHH